MVEFSKILHTKNIRPEVEKALPSVRHVPVKPKPVIPEEPLKKEPSNDIVVEFSKMAKKGKRYPGMPVETLPATPVYDERVSFFKDPFLFYQKMFDEARALLCAGVEYEKINSARLVDIVNEAVSGIMAGDDKLVGLAVSHLEEKEEYYLFQHSVNVCILSLITGKGLNYEKEKMVELGLAAFLHDIGMTCYENMVQTPRHLTSKEYDELKNHVHAGDKILRKINPGLSETIIAVQYEIHERMDGSGYPTGKKIIHDYARIIALADAFESLVHPRPFRPRYSIMEVYKKMFDAKNKYDQNFIKVMVDQLGFFPNGSFVLLSTKEVGEVVAQNPKSPLRPIVKIIYRSDGVKMGDDNVKEADLTKYPTIHIKKCFLDLELESAEERHV